MTEHYLDPLLKPRQIALLGASDKTDSPGQILTRMIIDSDYSGKVYPVNPGYPEILGHSCYPDLDSLPETVDQVVIALGNSQLEAALLATIKHGAKAATIYSSGVLESDSEPKLLTRLQTMAKAAGIMICGVNGMGYYNVSHDLFVGIFPRSMNIIKGGISYIAQSGSAFTTLCHNGCRLGFNLCVSSGNEITVGVADYMDWCLEQPDTRVIGLFLETVRDPETFVAALEKATNKGIPVVILKIGKSESAAKMALTHTGAIAGNHAVFQALCKRHGIIEVADFDEMASILMLLQSDREVPDGEFAAVFESGGFRELITDKASDLGLNFAELNNDTKIALSQHLDPGLKAENPLDAWGSHDRFEHRFEACLNLIMQDPNVAAGAFISNYRDGYYLSEAIYRVVVEVSEQTRKPIALATCYSDLANTEICERAQQLGIPVIDGANETLLAFKHLFEYRDFKQRQQSDKLATELDSGRVSAWKQKIKACESEAMSEADALALLGDFSLPVVSHKIITNAAELKTAAESIKYPLVLKTAQQGFNHKSDSLAVFVNIQTEQELMRHYDDFCNRLGPNALVAQMVTQGVEISLGTLNDPHFGPIVMVAAGGILVELLSDRAVAMCPISTEQAEELIASLKINQLLLGVRGNKPCNRQLLIDAIVNLSAIAVEFSDCIAEIDINPILVNTTQACAVDALIVPKS